MLHTIAVHPGAARCQHPEIAIIYLQPRHTQPGEIGFETFADWVQQFGDPLSLKFSQSLRRWAASPAGMQG
jgi:hypothetical protein